MHKTFPHRNHYLDKHEESGIQHRAIYIRSYFCAVVFLSLYFYSLCRPISDIRPATVPGPSSSWNINYRHFRYKYRTHTRNIRAYNCIDIVSIKCETAAACDTHTRPHRRPSTHICSVYAVLPFKIHYIRGKKPEDC